MNKNVYAEKCPADKIREYVGSVINAQKRYVLSGKDVPDDLLIPSKIELSPENIKYLLNSKLVDYIGAGETGNEINFYWKESNDIPALEVRTRLENDGKYYLTYIREEASKDKVAFEWDVDDQSKKSWVLTVSKITDALEDIVDMDEYEKRI